MNGAREILDSLLDLERGLHDALYVGDRARVVESLQHIERLLEVAQSVRLELQKENP